MAAGKWKAYEQAKLGLGRARFNFATDTFNVTLHSSTSNANTLSTSAAFADITNELATANGYTAGGVALTGASWTNSAGTETLDFADAQWTASGGSITARYAVIRKVGTVDSVANPIVAVCQLDYNGGSPQDVTVTDGNTLTIQIANVLTLSGMASDT